MTGRLRSGLKAQVRMEAGSVAGAPLREGRFAARRFGIPLHSCSYNWGGTR